MFHKKYLIAFGASLLMSASAFAQTPAANDNDDSDGPATTGSINTGAAANGPAGAACQNNFQQMKKSCDKYMSDDFDGASKKDVQIKSTVGGLNAIDSQMEESVKQSFAQSRDCRELAHSCVNNCSKGNTADKKNSGSCLDRAGEASRKHKRIVAGAKENTKDNKEAREQVSAQKPRDRDKDDKPMVDKNRDGKPDFPDVADHRGHGHSNFPGSIANNDRDGDGKPDRIDRHDRDGDGKPDRPTNPQSANNDKNDKPATTEKTPEQAKEERREKKREERREERMSALGSAFMNLNPKSQAMGENSMAPASAQPQTAAAAAAAGALPGAVAGKPTTTAGTGAGADDDDDDSRAGFNALAKKNLESRKALARSMGINSKSLPAVSALPSMHASGNSGLGIGGAPTFGGGSSFDYSAQAITLDPVANVERPSNLPQNFKLGTPSGGGGGRGGGSEGTGVAGLNARKQARRSPANAGDSPEGDSADHTTVAVNQVSQSPAEIRAQNADIWNVISVSFRKHCAQGRLMDCAGHLPK